MAILIVNLSLLEEFIKFKAKVYPFQNCVFKLNLVTLMIIPYCQYQNIRDIITLKTKSEYINYINSIVLKISCFCCPVVRGQLQFSAPLVSAACEACFAGSYALRGAAHPSDGTRRAWLF